MEIEIQIHPGVYEPYIEMSDEGSWGSRVSKLGITRNGFLQSNARIVGYAGVDSGQMMIIDTDAIPNWEDSDGDFEEGIKNKRGELSYFGACNATLGVKMF